MNIMVVESKARYEQLMGLAKEYQNWQLSDWKEPENYPALAVVTSERIVTKASNTEKWAVYVNYITKNDLLRVLMPKNGTESDFLAELMSGQVALEDREV